MADPNEIVAVTRGYLDSMNLTLVALTVLACLFFVVLGLFLYMRYRTPREAWAIKECSNRGEMGILVAGLDKYADIYPVKDLTPEGVKETKPIGKGAKKMCLRFSVPKARLVNEDEVHVEDGKDKVATMKVIQALYDLNTQPVFLRKAKVPFMIAVRNSVAAVSLKFLGVQAFLEKLEKLQKDGVLYKQIAALKASEKFRELGLWLEDLASGVTVLDFQEIYSRATTVVGQTKLDNISERDQTIGRREGKEANANKDDIKLILALAMGIIGVLIAGAVVISVLR